MLRWRPPEPVNRGVALPWSPLRSEAWQVAPPRPPKRSNHSLAQASNKSNRARSWWTRQVRPWKKSSPPSPVSAISWERSAQPARSDDAAKRRTGGGKRRRSAKPGAPVGPVGRSCIRLQVERRSTSQRSGSGIETSSASSNHDRLIPYRKPEVGEKGTEFGIGPSNNHDSDQRGQGHWHRWRQRQLGVVLTSNHRPALRADHDLGHQGARQIRSSPRSGSRSGI